jgi:hypothetical protein
MERRLIFLILMFGFTICRSQILEIKNINRIQSDLSASVNQRNDSNGVACGLVKLLLMNHDISFDEKVVGNVDNKLNELWVYLPSGTKEFVIKQHNYIPIRVKLSEFGIDEIESKVTYKLTLKEKDINKEKCSVVINVRPVNGIVKIDGETLDQQEEGSYLIYLEKGEHICQFEALGHKPVVRVIESGKGTQTMNVEMESLLAKVTINSMTTDADISINGIGYGIGSWTGELPEGDYIIELKKEGYSSVTQNVHVVEKGDHIFSLPSLQQLKGSLRIILNMTDFNIFKIDGKDVNLNNGCLDDLISGNHTINIVKYGYKPIEATIRLSGNKEDTLKCEFEPTDEYKIYLEGDNNMLRGLGMTSLWKKDYEQAVFWLEKTKEYINKTKKDVEKIDEIQLFYTLADIYANQAEYVDAKSVYNLSKAEMIYNEIIQGKYYDFQKSPAYSNMIEMWWSAGDLNKAESWMNKAWSYLEGWRKSEAALRWADLYLEKGNKEKASYWIKCVRDDVKAEKRYKEKAQLKLSIMNM